MRLGTPTLLLFSALVAGCYYPPPYYGPPPPNSAPGNIAVSWTFAGASCAQTLAVVQVRVSTPSDPTPIQPDTFACSVGDPPGQLVIYGYVPGSYVVQLVGLDSSGNTIWTGSGTANVVAYSTVSLTIDLQPAGGGNAVVNLSWAFAPTVGSYFPPCTTSASTDPDRLDSVALYVDGAATPAATYDCSQGTGAGQVSTPTLTPGSHSLQLVGYQTGLSYSFAETQAVQVTISSSGPVSQSFTFDWLVGGAGVAWTYPVTTACDPGRVAAVTVAFLGPGSSGYSVAGWPCASAVAPFKRLPAVAGGTSYALTVNALGGPPSPVLYSGTGTTMIQPGRFYDGTSATVVTVPLN